MIPISTCIYLFCILSSLSLLIPPILSFNLTLPHQHPNPLHVVHELQRRINVSLSRRQMLSIQQKDQCLTGNPIDDCWRCDPNWEADRQKLADCGIGFGGDALGGKGGQIYVVTDSSDNNPENPVPGTLRFAVIQSQPLWIIFSADMAIKLNKELIINNFKTLDGRGTKVHITGKGCITIEYVSNIIIHNIHIHHCNPSPKDTASKLVKKGRTDGDGISIYGSHKIWIDHCALSYCTDGLIDVTEGSTGITISNNYLSHHDKVMLLGNDDSFEEDRGMQVTVAFNHFGEGLLQRMPRCRLGYFHVVNNDYSQWGMYAIGGSANPTINSQGNRYTAPSDPKVKEVTKRLDTDDEQWASWNWRSDGDVMMNGAFFVASGEGLTDQFAKASSVEPKTAQFIDQLTFNAGVFGDSPLLPNTGAINNGDPSYYAATYVLYQRLPSKKRARRIIVVLLVVEACRIKVTMVVGPISATVGGPSAVLRHRQNFCLF